jgi:CRISPR/Cas system-associated exonuclease Cas4 (RecB family)
VLAFAATLFLAAIALLVGAAWLASRTGVRVGATMLASDVGLDESATLESPADRIRGRPDYLLRERGRHRIYPVEVKPTRQSATLYESDALQLAAYMLVTEAHYGRAFAGYGLVRYRSAEFRVTLTPELRRRCQLAAEGVRAARRATVVHRSHRVAARCRRCAVQGRCGESLGLEAGVNKSRGE